MMYLHTTGRISSLKDLVNKFVLSLSGIIVNISDIHMIFNSNLITWGL